MLGEYGEPGLSGLRRMLRLTPVTEIEILGEFLGDKGEGDDGLMVDASIENDVTVSSLICTLDNKFFFFPLSSRIIGLFVFVFELCPDLLGDSIADISIKEYSQESLKTLDKFTGGSEVLRDCWATLLLLLLLCTVSDNNNKS